MRWLSLLVGLAACGRYHFVDAEDASVDACVTGTTCTPAAVCWTGLTTCSTGDPCALDQMLDQVSCPGGGCSSGICVGPSDPAIGPAAGTNAYFGTSVDSDGLRILVGAVAANAAYVLEQNNGQWAVTATLTSSWGPAGSDFGAAVAIQGDLAVVGSRYSRGPGMPTASGTGGAIVIFERNAQGQWIEQQGLLGPDGGEFGNAIDLDRGRMVVGAEYATVIANGWGAAYIVEQQGSAWTIVSRLAASTADRLGHAVQLSGDRAFAGSLWDPGPVSTETGAVRVWERQADATWLQTQTLQPDDLRVDAFGQGFSVDGDRIAVGVPWFSDPDRGTGAVYIYSRDASGLWQTPGPIAPPLKQRDGSFGRGVLLRGDRVFATSIDWSSTPSPVLTSVYRFMPSGELLEVGRRIDPGGQDNGFAYGGIEVDLQMASAGDDIVVGYPVRGYSGGRAPGAIVVQNTAGW